MPVATPVTTPAPEIVAIPVALLLHTPPPTASDNVVVLPKQTDGAAGFIEVGVVFTVIIVDAEQLPTVYKIVAVPLLTAVTRPPAEIVATVGVALLHAPLPVASVSVILLPMQRLIGVGLIAKGVALTVTVVVE